MKAQIQKKIWIMQDFLQRVLNRIRREVSGYKQKTKLADLLKKDSTFLGNGRFECNPDNILFCTEDKTSSLHFDAHYTYHPAWAARIIARNKPEKHVDISSILNFTTMLSAFIPVDYYEFRAVDVKLPGMNTFQCDILSLPFSDTSIKSLSCMHVVEHIGLGRYGDAVDPEGDLKAALELQRVLAIGGTLLFVVPIGHPELVFNAHRIYSYQLILQMFKSLELKSFSMLTDNLEFVENADKSQVEKQRYACGCFEFYKKQ